MPTLRQIKRKIQSVKNTAQITKAMEAVSATKMRRAQEVALRSRPYALSSLEILANIAQKTDIKKHFLLKKRKDKKICLAVVAADKGLCGVHNGNIFKKITSSNLNLDAIDFVAIGKKARDWLKRRNYKIIKEFVGVGDYISILQSGPIAEFLTAEYKNKHYSRILACFTNFKTTLKQEPVLRQILPLEKKTIEEIIEGIAPEFGKYALAGGQSSVEIKYNFEYKFEPSTRGVLSQLLPDLFETLIYHIILESNASEHSSRMVAMKNASDNATKILEILRLNYNKARQAAITKEIGEVINAAEAMA